MKLTNVRTVSSTLNIYFFFDLSPNATHHIEYNDLPLNKSNLDGIIIRDIL